MREFWAVIGCACMDREFREEIQKAAGSAGGSAERFMDYMMTTWGFPLTRFEAEHALRAFGSSSFVAAIRRVDDVGLWEVPCIAWAARTGADLVPDGIAVGDPSASRGRSGRGGRRPEDGSTPV